MNFGNEFDVYGFCLKKWNLKESSIVSIEQKRTYKRFVEYTIFWEEKGEEGTYQFKIIKKDNDENY